MARVDTLGNFLTDVADAIREKTGESGTIQASSFDTAISNISGGGGSSSKAYCCGFNLRIYDNATEPTSSPLSLYSTVQNSANIGSIYSKQVTSKGLVLAFVRSSYTLPNNLELIAESEWFTSDGSISQKLLVCWCEENSTYLTQANSGRTETMYVSLQNAKKPTSANILINTINTNYAQTSYVATATDNLCIFVESCVYQISPPYSTFVDTSQFDYIHCGYRLACETTTTAGQKNLIINGSVPTAIIGIEIETE